MSEGLRDWDFRPVYEASASNLVDDFYVPALRRATRYDRAAGYFRASVYHLIAIAVSDFVLRGGQMRLVCSPSLAAEDEAAIRRFGVRDEVVSRSLESDVEKALSDPEQLPVVELLATLLVAGALDIRIAYKADERGIFHPKVGIFHDGVDAMSFEGSTNETFMAWEHNEERFKTFCSWRGDAESLVTADISYFDALWNGERRSLVVKPLPEIPLRLLRAHALDDPAAAVERVRIARSRRRRGGQRVRRLQDHQLLAKTNWWEGRRGIIDHVTGSGKTVTALAIIREWQDRYPDGTVVVLVPSDLLTRQWRAELDSEMGDLELRILHVGGSMSSASWPDNLADFTRPAQVRGRRIVIATMDSAASAVFLQRASVGPHTLMVADEVHKVGSVRRRLTLNLDAGGRLGLSATPERFEDPDGTAVIFEYFGDRLPPRFGIREAQRSVPPRLVEYKYQTDVVALERDELESYDDLTRRAATASARLRDGDPAISAEQLRLILIRRAAVLKKARSKVAHAVDVLGSRYQRGDRWLVYCDDVAQLSALRAALPRVSIDPMTYVSDMIFSKPDTLLRFEEIGGVLLSIRCLDEGIDIPVVDHALILASSLNPREHLQRRGRVLRTAPKKDRSYIFDVLVGPDSDDMTRVFPHELARAQEFARDAVNRREAIWRLESLIPATSVALASAVPNDVEEGDADAEW